MTFNISRTLEILRNTPPTLRVLLTGLDTGWTSNNEGEGTWNVNDVLGHLIYSDTHNWLLRAKSFLSGEAKATLPPYDRFAQFEIYKDHAIPQLLEKFAVTRAAVLSELAQLLQDERDFEQPAVHPQLGEVHLKQLLSAWPVHDLTHISQISRIIAKQYSTEVGPWSQFLRILK